MVILVSGNAIVFGADSKGVDSKADEIKPIATSSERKVLILQKRILISSTGVARIKSETGVIYDFGDWVETLRIPANATIRDVAEIIKTQCSPIFEKEWKYLTTQKAPPPPNLSGNPTFPWVTYYVGGIDSTGPTVYCITVKADWVLRRFEGVEIVQVYPAPASVTSLRNIFLTFHGDTGGGIDQLTTFGSEIQRKYLKMYDKEVGAVIYDEPLDQKSLTKAADILLSLEIKTNPQRFEFPITVCTVASNQDASCQVVPGERDADGCNPR